MCHRHAQSIASTALHSIAQTSKVLAGLLPLVVLCCIRHSTVANDLLASSITATARTAHPPPQACSYRFNNLIFIAQTAQTTVVLTVADVGPHQHQLQTNFRPTSDAAYRHVRKSCRYRYTCRGLSLSSIAAEAAHVCTILDHVESSRR